MKSILHLLFTNPLYGLPHMSLVLALAVALLSLGGLCINAWRNLAPNDDTLDAGMNVLIYSASFILCGLAAAFLHYHVRDLPAVILGAMLAVYACMVLDDSAESESMPLWNVLLIVLTSANLALRLWTQSATHGWWTSLVSPFDTWQSITLWLIEAVLAWTIIRCSMKVVRRRTIKVRRSTVNGYSSQSEP